MGGDGIFEGFGLGWVGLDWMRGRGRVRGRGVKVRWLGGVFCVGDCGGGGVFEGVGWGRREGCGRWANFCVGSR